MDWSSLTLENMPEHRAESSLESTVRRRDLVGDLGLSLSKMRPIPAEEPHSSEPLLTAADLDPEGRMSAARRGIAVFRYRAVLPFLAGLMVMLATVSNASGPESGPAIKLSAAGASNTQDTDANDFQSYVIQSRGRFKSDVAVSNIAFGGNSANSANQPANFATVIQPSYDAAKPVNILSLQFGGGNSGDLTSDPASVRRFYKNLVGIAGKWKALGPSAKVVVFTPWGYGSVDLASAANITAASALILADKTNFDAVIESAAISAIFSASTSCPEAAISADCNHLTRAGSALLVPAYVAAVNSVF